MNSLFQNLILNKTSISSKTGLFTFYNNLIEYIECLDASLEQKLQSFTISEGEARSSHDIRSIFVFCWGVLFLLSLLLVTRLTANIPQFIISVCQEGCLENTFSGGVKCVDC